MAQLTKPERYTGSVVSIARGYYGNCIRDEGEKFHVDEVVLGSWMKPVDPDYKAPVKAKSKATTEAGRLIDEKTLDPKASAGLQAFAE